jgi:hypothetical protein
MKSLGRSSSRFENVHHGGSRHEEAQMTSEMIINFEPPHVGCCLLTVCQPIAIKKIIKDV